MPMDQFGLTSPRSEFSAAYHPAQSPNIQLHLRLRDHGQLPRGVDRETLRMSVRVDAGPNLTDSFIRPRVPRHYKSE
jgi:hypothetical protein